MELQYVLCIKHKLPPWFSCLFFWQKRVNEWKVAVAFFFPHTDGSWAPKQKHLVLFRVTPCVFMRVFLKHKHKRDFFFFFFLTSGEFWIFLCHGSLAGSHFLPIWVTYKPAVISLQISNTARSKYINVPFVCFFFSLTGSKLKISFVFVGVAIYTRGHQWELKRFHYCSSPEKITVSFEFISLYLQWFRFPACHHGHASSYFLSSSWQTKSIVDTAVYREAASVRDQQN